MLKRLLSTLLILVMMLSVLLIAPATTASAASYKDNIIDAVLNNESKWYKDWYDFGGVYGYSTVSFRDLNFDGNLEFIVTAMGGTMGNHLNFVYYYSNGKLVQATGGETFDNQKYCYIGLNLKAYYNKSNGGYKLVGSNYLKATYNEGGGGNYTVSYSGGKMSVKYHSSTDYFNGKTTYYNSGKGFGYPYGTKISKSKYDSTNNSVIKNCVDAKEKIKTVSLEDWQYRSTSSKKSLLKSSYEGYSLGSGLVSTPKISKFEAVSNGVTVKWSAISGAKNYRVYKKTSSGWKGLGNTTSTSYTDKTAKAGTTYTYTVRCLSSNGKYTTSGYNKDGMTIKYATTPKLKSTSYVSGGVKISWAKSTNAVKYRVFYKTSGSSWKKIGDTTSTSFVHKNGTKGKNYTYTVRCTTKSGKSYTSYFNKTGLTKKYKK